MIKGDIIFSEGEIEPTPAIFFLQSGRLSYVQARGTLDSVDDGGWACEPVLWTTWEHAGSMRAKEDSNLLAIDALTFQKTVAKSESQGVAIYRYAVDFVAYLNDCAEEELTDLYDEDMEIEDF